MNEDTRDIIVGSITILVIGFICWIGFIVLVGIGGNNNCDDCDSCQKIELINEN